MARLKGSKNKPKIRHIDPVSPEMAVAIHNAEHPDQHTEVYEMTTAEVKVKFGDGILVVTDPLKAAALSRHPKNASAKDEVPFPGDWDKMGKIQKLEWLTAHLSYPSIQSTRQSS